MLAKGKSSFGVCRRIGILILTLTVWMSVAAGCTAESRRTYDDNGNALDSASIDLTISYNTQLINEIAAMMQEDGADAEDFSYYYQMVAQDTVQGGVLLNTLLGMNGLKEPQITDEEDGDSETTEEAAKEIYAVGDADYWKAVSEFRKSFGVSMYEEVLAGFGSEFKIIDHWLGFQSNNTGSSEDVIEPEEPEEPEEVETISEEERQRLEAEALQATRSQLLDSIFVVNNALVDNYLNVREVPEGTVVAKLYPGNGGAITAIEGGWAQIISGNAVGWVSLEYIVTGDALFSDPAASLCATVLAEKLFLRSAPSTDAEPYGKLSAGDTVMVLDIPVGGWVLIQSPEQTAYVSADYVALSAGTGVGMTLEEEAAYLESIQKPEETAPAAPAAPEPAPPATEPAPVAPTPEIPPVDPTPQLPPESTEDEQVRAIIDSYRAAGTATEDVYYMTKEEIYLFACVIRMEAGNQPDEGRLAVANVIMNRIRNGYWGSTLHDVIYAPGQFSGTKENENGISRLDQYLYELGTTEACYQAAYAACAGINNIGDYMFFCSKKSADANNKYETFTRYIQIGNNVFYSRS